MRLLGLTASLSTIRLDLVYLHASLLADDKPEVTALATPVGATIEQWRAERDAYERAQDAAVVMSARTGRRDSALDRAVLTFGGVVRAVSPRLYDVYFRALAPSGVARARLDREVSEVERILGELARQPAEDPTRVAYESTLRASLAALVAARDAAEQADTALALARTRLEQFKLQVDRVRTETHGRLTALLADRKQADEYFRSKSTAPEEEEEPAPAPAPKPAG